MNLNYVLRSELYKIIMLLVSQYLNVKSSFLKINKCKNSNKVLITLILYVKIVKFKNKFVWRLVVIVGFDCTCT